MKSSLVIRIAPRSLPAFTFATPPRWCATMQTLYETFNGLANFQADSQNTIASVNCRDDRPYFHNTPNLLKEIDELGGRRLLGQHLRGPSNRSCGSEREVARRIDWRRTP